MRILPPTIVRRGDSEPLLCRKEHLPIRWCRDPASANRDNGPEFSDPRMIEFYRVDPEHNPTKLARRTYVFFCDPYNSQQKPHVERNHEEIRRVLVKGTSFDTLRQEDVNLMLSHVNSAPRSSLDGKTPYDEFVSFYGERGREFLDRLGIRRVNAESVVLDPMLLGEKFKREANRAILHRHGVL